MFWPSVCRLWRNGEVLRERNEGLELGRRWGLWEGLTLGLTVWTTFHLEAESDRDLRRGGPQRMAGPWDKVCACLGHGSESPPTDDGSGCWWRTGGGLSWRRWGLARRGPP